jgi:selenide,water dikinase
MRFDYETLPLLPNIRHYAELGCIPGGAGRNKRSLQARVRFGDHLSEIDRAILYDPQTSGGLFAAIDPSVWTTLSEQKEVTFWRIGEVTELVSNQNLIVLEVE